MRDETASVPKPMLEVGGKPILWYVLRGLQIAGIQRCVVITGYRNEIVSSRLRKIAPPSMQTETIFNPDWQLGNGISALAAADSLGRNTRILLHMSDHLIEPSALVHFEATAPIGCSLLVDPSPHPMIDIEDATLVQQKNGLIGSIGKGLEVYNAVDTGVFLLDGEIFSALRISIAEGDDSLSGGVRLLAQEGKLSAVPLPGNTRWQDLDTAGDMAAATELLSEGWDNAWS